jgi:hypothetical protein
MIPMKFRASPDKILAAVFWTWVLASSAGMASTVNLDGRDDLIIGKFEGSGGTRVYLNQTEVSTEATSLGDLKAMFR